MLDNADDRPPATAAAPQLPNISMCRRQTADASGIFHRWHLTHTHTPKLQNNCFLFVCLFLLFFFNCTKITFFYSSLGRAIIFAVSYFVSPQHCKNEIKITKIRLLITTSRGILLLLLFFFHYISRIGGTRNDVEY